MLHRRRTGSAGFYGISGRPGSLAWFGGVLFVLALILGLAAPIAAAGGAVEPEVSSPMLSLLGLLLALVGLAGVLLAQTDMGASWRVGVDEAGRNDGAELVTGGLFALVRNPVFSAMLLAQFGMLFLVPTVLSLLALVCLVAAVQLQVRVIEEPYLLRTYGPAFAAYAARTGRLVPGVGRLRPADAGHAAAAL